MSDARSHAFDQISVPEAYDRFLVGQLFEPWARELVRRAAPARGATVLDVATGPGTVARLIAGEVGRDGHVLGADISAPMLALAAARPAAPGAAPIEYVQCSATELPLADGTFDIVVCQQGLQFIPDRAAALREMHRVCKAGGAAHISAWAAERPLGLFGPIGAALAELGLAEPYPRAFDAASYTIAAADLRALLESAGFADVRIDTVELDCVWDVAADAVSAVAGTPFGPLVAALDAAAQERVRRAVGERLGCPAAGEFTVRTDANVARGTR